MQELDVWREMRFMIIDSHVHIGEDKEGARQNLAQLRKNMKAYGIDKAVVFPFNEKGNLVEASLELLSHKSRSIIPFLRFDPKRMTPERLETLLAEHDFAGVKLHPRAQNFDPIDRRYYPLYKKIEESGRPLLIHSRKTVPFLLHARTIHNLYSDPDRMVRLAKHFAGLDIILAHFAGISGEALTAASKEENLFIETSIFGTTYIVKMAAGKMGPEKMIFGSDSPYSDQELELLKIEKSGLSKSDKEKILYRNISRILKA